MILRRTVLILLAATALIGRLDVALAAEEESPLLTFIEAEQLEYRAGGENTFRWEAQGWIGGDDDKLWFKMQGNNRIDGPVTNAEAQMLYSRAIAAYWDLQVGARHDPRPRPSRNYAVIGIAGLAPYFFEVDTAAFVSDEGDLLARIEVEYELLLTQRLIAKSSADLNFAAQEVEALGIGAGISEVELGFHLRYEIVREIAPYIGVSWERKIGSTAKFAQRPGEEVDGRVFVAGIRFWY